MIDEQAFFADKQNEMGWREGRPNEAVKICVKCQKLLAGLFADRERQFAKLLQRLAQKSLAGQLRSVRI